MTILRTTLFILAGLTVASPAAALEPSSPQFHEIANRIGLDDEQQDAVSEVLYAHQEVQIDLEADTRRAEFALKRALDVDEPDRKEVLDLVDALNDAENQQRTHKIELILDLREIIDRDQWDQLESIKARAKAYSKGAPMPPKPPPTP